jgi:uncharacterized membrane protein
MATKRGLERIIFFTDAVTAIAITLLILPLVDLATNLPKGFPDDAGLLLAEHWPEILSFAISFVVIARLWVSHHAIFEHVDSYNTGLLWLTLSWAFTIVLLPLPTAITYEFGSSPITVGFYIGTMTANSLLLTAITLVVRHHPQLESKSNPVTRQGVRGSVTASGAFVLALIIGVTIPGVNYWALFLIALLGPTEAIFSRREKRRSMATNRS